MKRRRITACRASTRPSTTASASTSGGQPRTNGIESFWSMLKRCYVGTYHKMSPKHLDWYIGKFSGSHNVRDDGTPDPTGAVAASATRTSPRPTG